MRYFFLFPLLLMKWKQCSLGVCSAEKLSIRTHNTNSKRNERRKTTWISQRKKKQPFFFFIRIVRSLLSHSFSTVYSCCCCGFLVCAYCTWHFLSLSISWDSGTNRLACFSKSRHCLHLSSRAVVLFYAFSNRNIYIHTHARTHTETIYYFFFLKWKKPES